MKINNDPCSILSHRTRGSTPCPLSFPVLGSSTDQMLKEQILNGRGRERQEVPGSLLKTEINGCGGTDCSSPPELDRRNRVQGHPCLWRELHQSLGSYFEMYLFILIMCVCISIHVHEQGQKRALDFLQLEYQEVLSCPREVLGTKHRSSVSQASCIKRS